MGPSPSWLFALVVLALALVTSSARASELEGETKPATSLPVFDQPLAIGGYTLGGFGAYDAGGVGGRARWEFWQHRAGLDLFGEAMKVDWSGGGSRYDIPIGFNIYAPLALGRRVRVRGMAGFCAVFSMIQPAQEGAPPANDVLFGVHGGAGLEVALAGPVVFFVDAQAVWYVGHDRTSQSWSGSVSGAFAETVVFQPSTGLLLAFGR
jgi:hypothetical protein